MLTKYSPEWRRVEQEFGGKSGFWIRICGYGTIILAEVLESVNMWKEWLELLNVSRQLTCFQE